MKGRKGTAYVKDCDCESISWAGDVYIQPAPGDDGYGTLEYLAAFDARPVCRRCRRPWRAQRTTNAGRPGMTRLLIALALAAAIAGYGGHSNIAAPRCRPAASPSPSPSPEPQRPTKPPAPMLPKDR